jgi:hypothetical protein
MIRKFNFSKYAVLVFVILLSGVTAALATPGDQPDSSAYVGYGWNGYLPAFKDAKGVSIPFMPTHISPPLDYKGDFYVDEFTDAKIKQAWQELKAKDPEAAKKILADISANTDETSPGFRLTGWMDPKGVVNGNNNLNLTEIRRPAFFGQAPYFEEIAKVEKDTYTVEFTVPRDPYERYQLKITTPVKLRGWFIKGKGVPCNKGKRIHALVVYFDGSGGQLCLIQHPDAPAFVYDVQSKQYKSIPYPNKNFQTEKWGYRSSRNYLYGFNQAGFDVLIVDKRGHGISGSVNANNSAEMAEDFFRMLDQLESGDGMTVLTPSRQLLNGKEAAGLLLRGIPAKQVPVIIGGASQGSIITCFVMQKNFVGWTAYNEPDQKFSPARKYNIKAAISLANFSGGLGYCSDPDLRNSTGWGGGVCQEAAYRIEKNTMMRPTSEILANIDKWPAVFLGQGLWDVYHSPEGTFEAYRRATRLKELIFYRGSHSQKLMGEKFETYLINKMTEFAVRAIVNPGNKYPELKSFKEAVLNSGPYWDPTSRL